MRTCSQCGARSPHSAAWCSQCCLRFPAPAPVVALAYAGVGAGQADLGPMPAPVTPPDRWAPPPAAAPYTQEQAQRDGRLLDRRAAILLASAIGLGGIFQLIAVGLAHSRSIEPGALIRYDILLTIALYAGVSVMIVRQITPSIRLRWGEGSLVGRVGLGAGVGIGFSLLLLALVSAVAGHLQSDPRIVLLMSEGDPTHIVVMAFIGCVAAPLVEETLFRGLLLESLRPRGSGLAVLVSAAAFAAWHFMPASLVYYAALGAALGALYLKGGLACSIAAHVGFNAVLTIAAVMIVLGPSHQIQIADLSLTAPSGWSIDTAAQSQLPATAVVLLGPSDAQLEVVARPALVGVSAELVAARVRGGALSLMPGMQVDPASVREVMIPAGEVVEASLTVDSRQGTLALVSAAGQAYEVVFLNAGSAKAEADFDQMLDSMHAKAAEPYEDGR